MAKPSFPASQKVLKVGWVGTGPFSFYGHYIRVINNIYRDYNFLNMRVTHIWGDDYAKNYAGSPEYVKKLLDFWASDKQSPAGIAEMCGIPNVCTDFREMVDEVDAAMIMDFDRAYELAEPFLRRGLPIFLCSPVAITVPECERILDLAEANGSAVYTGSFTADMHDTEVIASNVKRDQIATFTSSTWFNFFTSYANDGLEPIHKILGPGVQTVQLVGWDGSGGYDPTGIPPSRIHLTYEPRDGNPPIQGTMHLGGGLWFRFVYRDHSVYEEKVGYVDRELAFRDFLVNIQEVFATNKSIETRDDIITMLKVVIAAYKSANEGNRPVTLDEVGDYRLPTVRIENWDQLPD